MTPYSPEAVAKYLEAEARSARSSAETSERGGSKVSASIQNSYAANLTAMAACVRSLVGENERLKDLNAAAERAILAAHDEGERQAEGWWECAREASFEKNEADEREFMRHFGDVNRIVDAMQPALATALQNQRATRQALSHQPEGTGE